MGRVFLCVIMLTAAVVKPATSADFNAISTLDPAGALAEVRAIESPAPSWTPECLDAYWRHAEALQKARQAAERHARYVAREMPSYDRRMAERRELLKEVESKLADLSEKTGVRVTDIRSMEVTVAAAKREVIRLQAEIDKIKAFSEPTVEDLVARWKSGGCAPSVTTKDMTDALFVALAKTVAGAIPVGGNGTYKTDSEVILHRYPEKIDTVFSAPGYVALRFGLSVPVLGRFIAETRIAPECIVGLRQLPAFLVKTLIESNIVSQPETPETSYYPIARTLDRGETEDVARAIGHGAGDCSRDDLNLVNGIIQESDKDMQSRLQFSAIARKLMIALSNEYKAKALAEQEKRQAAARAEQETQLTAEAEPIRKAEEARLAAEQGDVRGQHSLGWMYENGTGVEKDLVKALNWYQKAADQGDKVAQSAAEKLTSMMARNAYSGPDIAIPMHAVAIGGIYPGLIFQAAEEMLKGKCISCPHVREDSQKAYLSAHYFQGKPDRIVRFGNRSEWVGGGREMLLLAARKSTGKIYRVRHEIWASEMIARDLVEAFIKRNPLPYQHIKYEEKGLPVERWRVGNTAAAANGEYQDMKGTMITLHVHPIRTNTGSYWMGSVELLDADVYNDK